MNKKIINNKFVVGFLLIFLVSTLSANAMNAIKNRFSRNINWKNSAKDILMWTTVGGAYCGALAGGLALREYDTNEPVGGGTRIKSVIEEFDKMNPDVDPIVEEFVRTQLKECGVEDQKSLKIKEFFHWGSLAIPNHERIAVPHHYSHLIRDALKKKKLNPVIQEHDQVLMLAAALTHHEGGHILHRDWKIEDRWDNIIVPLAFMISPIAFLCKTKKIAIPAYTSIIIGSFPLASIVNSKYWRFKELKADDTIQDNIHLLRAMKKYLKDHLIDHREYYDNCSWYVKLDWTHPHPKVRIKRLKKRIKALKQKGDPKAFCDPFKIKEKEIK